MERSIDCLRCGRKMNHVRTEKLQFGQTGWILGDLPNLLAGAMEVDIYTCPKCKKIEFFLADEVEEGLPQKQCPKCGKELRWIRFRSPDWTWQELCGREGPLAICENCHKQVYFKCELMN